MKNSITREITISDFQLQFTNCFQAHYFSHMFKNGNELCLESCMSGYCVAIYDEGKSLIGEKTCTNLPGESRMPFGTKAGDMEAIEAALILANEKIQLLEDKTMTDDKKTREEEVKEAANMATLLAAQECYLQCLAVECGEGECARAIRTKFNLKVAN